MTLDAQEVQSEDTLMSEQSTAPDYKSTVLTPKTDFPQRGGLPNREPQFLERWEKINLAKRMEEKSAEKGEYILHDGPPYANGHIHIGHALNKILKDIIVRQKTMKGHRTTYIPGWDCHGLPIEQKVLEKLKKKKKKSSDKTPVEIREMCAEYANQWIETQKEEFIRLGVGGDWDHPYLTLSHEYEEAIVGCLETLTEKGYIFQGFKPVHWDPVYQTALAEAEIEYNDEHVSNTIYLRFPVVEGKDAGDLPDGIKELENPTIVIWTTTPWTIPANLGVSLNGELDYVGFATKKKDGTPETLIMAKGLLKAFQEETGVEGEIVAEFSGAILDKCLCAHPVFPDKKSLIMLGDHVTLDAGTGCVHTAPAHGVEDFIIGAQYELGVFNPVDEAGLYNELYPEMQGTHIFKANELLIEKFENEGSLVYTGKLVHSYPYSWRSHKPVIMRATEQWFMDVEKDGIKESALSELKNVQWIPDWGYDRINNMVAGRPDWCLSRQRSWGVPIPSIRDKKEEKSILNPQVIAKFKEFVKTEGSDCWYKRPVEDFLPESMKSEADRYEKEFNILDVWFDSGASHMGVLEARENLSWPADLYLEGSDQHRGWFQSSLWVAMGVKGSAPYKSVLTHGFVLDDKGRPMSKSLGNVVSPLDVIKQYGADVLRLWVSSVEYRHDVAISENILKQISDVYRRIRNTLRYLLGCLSDFDPSTHQVAEADMLEDDRWILSRLDELTEEIGKAFDEFQYHRIYHAISSFCVRELGAVYLDCAKDRLYCSHPDDTVRRGCQTAIHEIASRLIRMVAPVLAFTADEAWVQLPGKSEDKDCVHLEEFPVATGNRDATLLEKWSKLIALREVVQKAIEPLRAKENKVIGSSLEAHVNIMCADKETFDFVSENSDLLPRLLIVSNVQISQKDEITPVEGLLAKNLKLAVEVTKADGDKCERCWVRSPEVGSHAAHPQLCTRCFTVVERLGL